MHLSLFIFLPGLRYLEHTSSTIRKNLLPVTEVGSSLGAAQHSCLVASSYRGREVV